MRTPVVALLATGALLLASCSDSSVEVASSETLGSTIATSDTGSTDSGAYTTTAVTDPGAETTAGTPIDFDFTIEWTGELEPGVEQGYLEVPRDSSDPTAGTFRLYLVRHLADTADRIGSLLVNPGGPGFGGSILAMVADQVYGDDLIRSFEIGRAHV